MITVTVKVTQVTSFFFGVKDSTIEDPKRVDIPLVLEEAIHFVEAWTHVFQLIFHR